MVNVAITDRIINQIVFGGKIQVVEAVKDKRKYQDLLH